MAENLSESAERRRDQPRNEILFSVGHNILNAKLPVYKMADARNGKKS